MKTQTAAAGLVVAVALGAGYLVTDQVTRAPRTTNVMPKPKRLAPNADGRVYAVIQLCWRPAEAAGTVHYVVGPIDKVEGAFNLDCREPLQRKGLVRPGDQVIVSWAVSPHSTLRGVRYRITINNREAMGGEETASALTKSCVVGVPPC